MAGVNHTHVGALAKTKGSEPACFIGRTSDVNNRNAAAGWTRGKRARGACNARIVLLQSGKYERRRQVTIDENVSQTRSLSIPRHTRLMQ